MQKEDKELLLKDLSARLPYGVYCDVQGETKLLYSISGNTIGFVKNIAAMMVHCVTINNVKPYLRPLSSMTEEEKSYIRNTILPRNIDIDNIGDMSTIDGEWTYIPLLAVKKYIDYLHKNHFDFRRLIPKGLALEAPENMYRL